MLPAIASAVAVGTAIGHGRAAAAWPAVVGVIVALACAGVVRRHHYAAAVAAFAAIACVATASAAWRTGSEAARVLPKLASQRAVAHVCGTVTQRRPRSIDVAVSRVELGRSGWAASEPVRISGPGTDHVRVGERVCAVGEVHLPRPGHVEPPLLRADDVERRGIASPLRFGAGVVRERFARAAIRALPATQSGLLLGMTDGDTRYLDDATNENFRTTGLAHLVAVSGYNVAVFLAMVMLLVRRLARRRWVRVGVAIPFLVFFAFLTGLEPSVLRATVTAGVALVAGADGRTTDALRALAFAFVVLVLASPDMLFATGFQLSFAATLGIVIGSSPLADRIARALPDRLPRLHRAIASGGGTTMAAQLACAPVLAWHFGRIPGIGAFANLVAIPLAGVVMIGGLATLSAAALVPFLDWAPATMRLLLDVILASARTFARLPAASLSINAIFAAAITLAIAAFFVRSRRVRAGAAALVVVLVAVGGGRSLGSVGVACPSGEIRALDIGQGTAVLIRSGAHAVLLDGGPRDGGVVRQLRAVGVDRLDVAVVSHPHADHIEGLVDVLAQMPVGRVIGPAIIAWGVGGRVVAAAEHAHVPVATVAAGDVIDAGPIRLDVLAPDDREPPDQVEPDRVNGWSLLVRATVGGTTVIAPGDLTATDQAKLLDRDVRAPILIAPHHGSPNLDPDFVEAVHPQITLVTVGLDNPYGHPSPKALAVFERYGRVMRTDLQGLVTLCLRAGGADVWTQKGGTVTRPGRQDRSGPRPPDVFG